MDFGDVERSRNPHCTCAGDDDEMISPVDKAVQCMRDKCMEVIETFDWKPYAVQ